MTCDCDHSVNQEAAEHDWALVLAGGEGTRLRELTTTDDGQCIPKQFCSFGTAPSLLYAALQRARAVAPSHRTYAVVSEHHRCWWQSMPLGIPAENVVVQPYSRGTAHGILLPLLQILYRDPDAVLLVLPSDHHVCDEMMLASSLRQAMQFARQHDRIVLLGLMPEEADPELGYIVCDDEPVPGLRSVRQFIEKPSLACARALIFNGGLWNSFILAASGTTLLHAFELRCAHTVANLRHILERSKNPVERQRRLADLYRKMPHLDFSRDVLQTQTVRLSVLAVPYCGWSDLGTPRHVTHALHRSTPLRRGQTAPSAPAQGWLDLAARHAELQLLRQEQS